MKYRLQYVLNIQELLYTAYINMQVYITSRALACEVYAPLPSAAPETWSFGSGAPETPYSRAWRNDVYTHAHTRTHAHTHMHAHTVLT